MRRPTYLTLIEPITENEEVIHQILINFTGSEQQAAELIESGGVVIETDDKDEAERLARQLEEADAEVEIEEGTPQPDASEDDSK